MYLYKVSRDTYGDPRYTSVLWCCWLEQWVDCGQKGRPHEYGPTNISVWIQHKLLRAMQDFAAVQACCG